MMGTSAQWTFSLTSGMLKLFILSNLAGWDGQTLVIMINYYPLRVFIYSFYSCVCSQSLSHVWLCNPMAVGHQCSLSMGFPRQKYWSRLSFPSSEGLPDPGIEPIPPALQVDFFFFFFNHWAPGTPSSYSYVYTKVTHILNGLYKI